LTVSKILCLFGFRSSRVRTFVVLSSSITSRSPGVGAGVIRMLGGVSGMLIRDVSLHLALFGTPRHLAVWMLAHLGCGMITEKEE